VRRSSVAKVAFQCIQCSVADVVFAVDDLRVLFVPFRRCIVPTDEICLLFTVTENAPKLAGDDTLKIRQHSRILIPGHFEELLHGYAAAGPGEGFQAPPVVVGEPVHELHGEIAVEVNRLSRLVLTPAPAFPGLQEIPSREVADEFLLRIGGKSPKVAGLDDESHGSGKRIISPVRLQSVCRCRSVHRARS